MKLFLFIPIFLLSILIHPVSAAFPVVDAATEAGSNMIQIGIDKWLVGTADTIIQFADGITNTTNATGPSPGKMALFHMITYNYDPLANPGVISTIQSTAILFLFLFVIFVFSGMAYVMIHTKFPQTGQAIDYTLFQDKGFDYMEYLKTLGTVIVFIMFGFTAVWTLILLSSIISQMMTAAALDALVTTSQTGLIYLIMAFVYLILSIFMAIRVLGISIISSLILVLFALWQFHQIRDIINMVFVYFGILIFMQPILISIAAVGIMTIQWVSGTAIGHFSTTLLYLALSIILIAAALVLILGPALFGKLIKIGSKAVL